MDNKQCSFITNQDKFLAEIINGILPKTSQVDFLVGYFYFSGFEQIYEQLKGKNVRILVGMEVDTLIQNRVREVDEFTSQFKSRGEAKQRFFDSFIHLFNDTDEFDSEDKLTSFQLFYKKILNGTLEIRKTENPCHAKMYLFQYNDMVNEAGEQPGSVIIGSSNLTRSGLGGRVEINARFTDKVSFMDGQSIFEQLWQEGISIVEKNNIDEFNNKVIEHIWYEKLYSPYLMYLRVLHEYFNVPSNKNVLTPYDITSGKFLNLKYQTDAVNMALRAIEIHNGVIIADVVGLGKSIVGSTAARNLRLRTIIVAPPHLKLQWEEYKDEFGFTATVFSSGNIEGALKYYHSIVNQGEQYLIIIDEAHKYRNEYTRDYANLHNLCSGNKVILLTATPFNNRPEDIYSMIKLFQIPSKSTLKTVENLGASFKDLISNYKSLAKNQKDKKLNSDEVVKEADNIAKKIRSIISPLVVRRSRLDLEEIPDYKEDIEKQGIKTMMPNDPILLEYELGGYKNLYIETLNRIAVSQEKKDNAIANGIELDYFKAARYQPSSYVIPEMKGNLEKELERKTGIKYNLLLGTQENLAWFMRRLLVRRFESSVYAFLQTLNYMISSSEHILDWIEKRNRIPIYKKGYLPAVEDFYETSNDDIDAELTEKFEKYTDRGFFEIDMKYIREDFKKEIESDLNLLRGIRRDWFGEAVSHYNPKTKKKEEIFHIHFDPKLDAFKQILADFEEREPNRKLIVFTEFADTANYLGNKLKETSLRVMKYTSADANSSNKETIRANFDAGYKTELQRDDYHILIATDAISEGYNLHRAGAVFNYDIPYNPTRVIQRIGRINRINKKMFDELYIFNYFPTAVGEAETRTKEISTLKMAMIHAIMGEDTKALTHDEELKSYFKERYDKEIKQSESASWDNKYRLLLNSLKGSYDLECAKEIPHKSRIARKNSKHKSGVLVFGKKGNDYVFKFGDSAQISSIAISAEEALSLFDALPSEEPFKVSKKFDSIYQRVKFSLFKNQAKDKNEKQRLEAIKKVKVIQATKKLNQDYIIDLMKVIQSDGLSGYELRLITQLTPQNYSSLPQNIEHDYLVRQLTTIGKVDDGAETLILSEELQ